MRILLLISLCAFFFALGVHSVVYNTAVFRLLKELRPVQTTQSRYANEYGQYIFTADKTEIRCPPQTGKTLVVVAFGQSNAANHLEQKHRGDARVVNLFNGHCYVAADPLLGASGFQGSVWTDVGNRLLDTHDYVVLIPLGIGGSSVTEWRSGRLNVLLSSTLADVKDRGYSVTHFLWHQGEADRKSSENDYAMALAAVIATTRTFFPESYFFVSVASRCEPSPANVEIQKAQAGAVNAARRIFPGPNTDSVVERYDGCHFSAVGQERFARLWVSSLRARPAGAHLAPEFDFPK